MTRQAEAWATIFEDETARQVVLDADASLRALLAEHGWPESLADALAPLFLADFFSPYANLGLGHPGALQPYEEDLPGPFLLEHGLLLIGYCPNGDSIAVRAVGEPGAVVYISHEEFDYDDLSNLPQITREVAGSVSEYLLALKGQTAPLDYWGEGEEEEDERAG